MSDIIHLSTRAATPETRGDPGFIGAATLHLLSEGGDPIALRDSIGDAYEFPNALSRLRDAAVERHLLEHERGIYRVCGMHPGHRANAGLAALAEPLAATLRAVSGPAILKRLLETDNDRIILVAGDILGTLRENGSAVPSCELAEQLAWTLATEGPEATRHHLSFIDEAMSRELPEVRTASTALAEARRRATEVGSSPTPVSDGFLRIAIERHSRRVDEAQKRAIATIDRHVGEILAHAAPERRTSASAIMADIVSHRTGPLALSEFDFRRLPETCRLGLEHERLVYRPVAGEGALDAYPGHSLADREACAMTSCLSQAAGTPEKLVRIAAVYANITRRNAVVVGSTESEAAAFLEGSKDASLRHHAVRRARLGRDNHQR